MIKCMFVRRKVLFNLIKELEPVDNITIQKSMFVYIHDYLQGVEGKPYHFFPNLHGCYSLTLSDDYHYLQKEGYLNYRNEKYETVKSSDNDKLFAIDSVEKLALKRLANFVKSKSIDNLVRYTYSAKPALALRSEWLYLMDSDDDFAKKLQEVREIIERNPHAIYTIGYEGRTIDSLLSTLIQRNVKTLIDVRKNAFSMRREYGEAALKRALTEAGIEYVHCPEIGIDTSKRKELIPDGKLTELFDWYKCSILPKNSEFVEKAYKYFEKGNVVFLCYEKDPLDCHRSRLADYCLETKKDFNRVIHL